MDISKIENEIISTLQASLPELKVEGCAESPSEYKLLHPKGAVLVRFQEAAFSAPQESAFIQQETTLIFNLNLMVKGLRDKNGAYSHINEILTALTGYTPGECGKMYPTKVFFLREAAGIWEYSINFAVPAVNLD